MSCTLRCPECRKKFSWDPQLPWPKACPFPACAVEMDNDRADDDIVMPFISAAKHRATDDVYRQMEKGSEVRAQHAANMAGVPVEDMASLKITDLRPTKHAGDIAAPEVRNPVTEFMGANPGIGGFQGSNGVGYSGAVQSGASPNAGAKMRTVLQGMHGERTGDAAISDRPAVETTAPGYRRRG